MTTEAAKPTETTEKKKRKKRFPAVGDFKTKKEYLEAMVKIWQEKLEHYKKFGDGEKAKKIKKGKKVLDNLDALMKDPDCADIIMEARKKLAGKGQPAPVKT